MIILKQSLFHKKRKQGSSNLTIKTHKLILYTNSNASQSLSIRYIQTPTQRQTFGLPHRYYLTNIYCFIKIGFRILTRIAAASRGLSTSEQVCQPPPDFPSHHSPLRELKKYSIANIFYLLIMKSLQIAWVGRLFCFYFALASIHRFILSYFQPLNYL